MAEHWNRHDAADRVAFAQAIQPLASASRSKGFDVHEARAYMVSLADVPRDVLTEAVDALLRAGVTWMPKPGEIKAACAGVVAAKRSAAAVEARALQAECATCDGTGFERVTDEDGVERVKRCWCAKRAVQMVDGVGDRIALPAAPESAEVD